MILREMKNMYVSVFQRIEYLESTGTQYIDTEVLMDSDTAFRGTTVEFEILKISTSNFTNAVIAGALTQNYHNYNLIVFNGHFYINGGFVFSQNDTELNTKTTATIAKNSGDIPNLNFILFGRNIIGLPIQCIGRIRIYSCKIIKNGDIIRDFIPVRVGSVGYLYDSVSKRLFGNKGTGNFVLGQDVNSKLQQIYQNKLIEGVDYDTYDWLKGDAVAYINTNYLLDFDDIKTSIFRLYNTRSQVFEGSRTGNYGAGTVIAFPNGDTYGSFFSPNGSMAHWNRAIPINIENTVVMSKNGITLNGTNISSTNVFPIVGSRFESVTPYLIFASWGDVWQIDDRRQKVDYKSFEIEGKLHLVPCQLLHSIPRNLDAQCKERVAGECGMIDLISGKFYGNVANSGTFTVENDNNE